MLSRVLLAASVLAGFSAATPLPSEAGGLQVRATDNCTDYTSPSAGHVCVHRPSDCSALYTVQPQENCISLAQRFGNYSLSVFYYWNPDIGSACTNLRAYVPYCINTPWYKYEGQIQPAPGTIKPAATKPKIDQPFPIPYNTTAKCNKYELAGDGVYVYNMVNDNHITFDQFHSWNPYTDDNNVVKGFWYCVGTK